MLRLVVIRALLFSLPFAAWFLWRAVRLHRGQTVRPTPWAWLVAAGAMMTAVSLIGAASFHSGGTGQYVPAQARPDGSVAPAHFEERKTSPS